VEARLTTVRRPDPNGVDAPGKEELPPSAIVVFVLARFLAFRRRDL
jgi:hypothetical protein